MEQTRSVLESLFIRGFFPFLSFLFTLIIVAAGSLVPPAASLLKSMTRKGLLSLAALILLSVSIWLFAARHIPHVFFDQILHLDLAHNMAGYGLAAYTEAGSPSSYEKLSLSEAWPPAYSYMLSLVFKVCGSSESAAFAITLVFNIISLMIMYFLIYTVTEREPRAFWGTFLLAVSPVFIKYSATYSLEVCSLAFLLLSAWSAVLAFRFGKPAIFGAAVVIATWTCYIRAENLILMTLMVVLSIAAQWLINRKKPGLPLRTMVAGAAFSMILLIPMILELYYIFAFTRPPEWKNALTPYGSSLLENLVPNILFLMGKGDYHPLLLTILSIAGVIVAISKEEWKKNTMMTALQFCWLIICLLLYSSYQTGQFGTYSDSDRYSLNIMVPLSYLGACALERAFSFLQGWLRYLCILACLVTLILTSWTPLRNSTERTTSRSIYREYEFIKSIRADMLPDSNVPIVCFTPAKIVLLLGRRAMSINYFMRHMDSIDEAVLFQDFFWHEAIKPESMAQIEMKIQQNYSIQHLTHIDEGSIRYGMYILRKK